MSPCPSSSKRRKRTCRPRASRAATICSASERGTRGSLAPWMNIGGEHGVSPVQEVLGDGVIVGPVLALRAAVHLHDYGRALRSERHIKECRDLTAVERLEPNGLRRDESLARNAAARHEGDLPAA